jgi:hypothetical protein
MHNSMCRYYSQPEYFNILPGFIINLYTRLVYNRLEKIPRDKAERDR